MSKQGGYIEIDKVAEYLLKLKRNKNEKELSAAIDAHNSFMDTFRRYKEFYEKHQDSYSKSYHHNQGQLERQDSKDAPNALNRLRKEIEDLKFEKETMQKQIEELKTRLSTLAGHKMIEGNPDIADLSDPFRPTQLAEKFREIYDEEWTHAFEELETISHDESKIIDTITYLITEIETFCAYTSTQQIMTMETLFTEEIVNPKVAIHTLKGLVTGKTPSEMNNTQKINTNKMIRDLRKSFGTLSVRPLIQIFDDKWMMPMRQEREKKLPSKSKEIDKFVEKAFEIIWLMKIQNPPMVFHWQKRDEIFDRQKFIFYTKRGDKVGQTVWPAVLLHEDGPLMSKGIVQAK